MVKQKNTQKNQPTSTEFFLEDEVLGRLEADCKIVDVEVKRLIEIIPEERLRNPKHKNDYGIIVYAEGDGFTIRQLFRLPKDKIIRRKSNLYAFLTTYKLKPNPKTWIGKKVKAILTQRRGLAVWRLKY